MTAVTETPEEIAERLVYINPHAPYVSVGPVEPGGGAAYLTCGAGTTKADKGAALALTRERAKDLRRVIADIIRWDREQRP